MKAIYSYMPSKPIKDYPNHQHNEWEITYQISGEATIYADDKILNLQTGDIIILPPNTYHYGVSETTFVDTSILASDLDFSGLFVVHDKDGSIGILVKLFNKVMLEKDINYRQIADGLLASICLYIKKFSNDNARFPFVQELKNTIYNNFSKETFKLSDAMTATGFNCDYIRRCFKEETGKTPHEYLTSLRIEYAKAQLTRGDFVSIEDSSSKCGFSDSFYFSTCFKKHTGISPLQYRKQAIN